MPLENLLRSVWNWRGRVFLAVLLLYAALGGLVWLWPRSYVAQMVVAPAETTAMATSTLLTPMPLLQPALLDSRPGGNFGVYLGALRSMEAARLLAAETPILARMTERRALGALGWLRRSFDWRIEADADDVLGFLDRALSPTQDGATVTWTVELPWFDRALALDMLTRLHAYAETKVRADLMQMAARRVASLETRIGAERDAFSRNAMYDLLAQHQRAVMVMASDEAVAARVVSHPMVEQRPSLPNRPLLLALLAVAVPLFCVMAAFCAALLRAPPEPEMTANEWLRGLTPANTNPARRRARADPRRNTADAGDT